MNIKTASIRITALLTTGILSSTIIAILTPINRSTAVAQSSNHQSQELAQSLIVSDLAAFNLASDNDAFIPIHLEQELNNPSGGRGVLGTDDRIEVLSQNYPWSAIGRIEGEVNP